jgi:hypothetical protein
VASKRISRKARARKHPGLPVYPHKIESWVNALHSAIKGADALATALHEQVGPDWNQQQSALERADACFEQARQWISASKGDAE